MSNLDEKKEVYDLLIDELDRPVKTIGELATTFCVVMECRNCPVMREDYDKRTEYEKTCLHEPCVVNLYKWIKDRCITEYVDKLKEDYRVLQGENSEICEQVFDRLDKLKEEILKSN